MEELQANSELNDVSLVKWVKADSFKTLGWHICAMSLWAEVFENIDMICSSA